MSGIHLSFFNIRGGFVCGFPTGLILYPYFCRGLFNQIPFFSIVHVFIRDIFTLASKEEHGVKYKYCGEHYKSTW